MNPSSSSPSSLTNEEITVRARALWNARGRPVGRDEEIWLEAESQLAAERRSRQSSRPLSSVTRRRTSKGVEIDDDALAERLDDFGEGSSRGPTSMNPTG